MNACYSILMDYNKVLPEQAATPAKSTSALLVND